MSENEKKRRKDWKKRSGSSIFGTRVGRVKSDQPAFIFFSSDRDEIVDRTNLLYGEKCGIDSKFLKAEITVLVDNLFEYDSFTNKILLNYFLRKQFSCFSERFFYRFLFLMFFASIAITFFFSVIQSINFKVFISYLSMLLSKAIYFHYNSYQKQKYFWIKFELFLETG